MFILIVTETTCIYSFIVLMQVTNGKVRLKFIMFSSFSYDLYTEVNKFKLLHTAGKKSNFQNQYWLEILEAIELYQCSDLLNPLRMHKPRNKNERTMLEIETKLRFNAWLEYFLYFYYYCLPVTVYRDF